MIRQTLCRLAALAQLGERQTEDLKVVCSIHALGIIGQLVRVVKEMDLKSIGVSPRRFESCS